MFVLCLYFPIAFLCLAHFPYLLKLTVRTHTHAHSDSIFNPPAHRWFSHFPTLIFTHYIEVNVLVTDSFFYSGRFIQKSNICSVLFVCL